MSLSTSGYPSHWPQVSKLTKIETGWRCVRCGHPDNPEDCLRLGCKRGHQPCDDGCRHPQDGKQRILTVHHLDGNKENLEWWNLAPLCQKCHLEIQGKVVMARVWMLEHSDWFKPYVGGYYATLRGLPNDRAFVERNNDYLLETKMLASHSLDEYPYYWYSKKRIVGRWLHPCRIAVQGEKRNIVVEFDDGERYKTFATLIRRRIEYDR